MEDRDGRYCVGELVFEGKKVCVKCLDKLLRLKGWQEPGKKYLPIHTFRHRFNPGKNLSLRLG